MATWLSLRIIGFQITRGRGAKPHQRRGSRPRIGRTLFDCGKAGLDHGLKFAIGENVRPVILDAFTHQFTHIGGSIPFNTRPVSS